MKINVTDDKAEKHGKSTNTISVNDNLKVDMTFEQIGKSAEIKSKIFNLKNNWITKTSKLSELLDGKPLNEILNVLRETFEEFRAEAKGQIPSDDAGVGNVALRLLDSTREFIRSFELIENKMVEEKNIVSFIQVTSDSRDYQMKNKGIKGEESEFSKNYSPSKELNYKNVKKINETNNISYRLVYKEQIESIIQSISNFLGIIDEMFPLFLPKPVPKKEIPINSLSVFQGLLKIMLLEDDTRFVKEMRNQWDVINTLLGEYDISVVCFEDEEITKDKKITKDEKIAWFEERSVNPNKFQKAKTSSPALIGSNEVILQGVVFIPRNPSE